VPTGNQDWISAAAGARGVLLESLRKKRLAEPGTLVKD